MEGRFIAPWHNVYWYADSDSFQQGITAIEDAYHQKGIEDYVIVKFHFPDPSMSYTQYSALKSEDVDGLDVKKLRENECIYNNSETNMGIWSVLGGTEYMGR